MIDFTSVKAITVPEGTVVRIDAPDGTIWTAPASGEVIPCTGFSFNYDAFNLTVGMRHTLRYTVTPENCTDPILWSSTNSDILRVEDGVITAVSEGSVVVTATCGGYSDTLDVEVETDAPAIPCSGLTLSETYIYLAGAVEHTLTATVEPEDCTDPVVWESENPDTASVRDGVVRSHNDGQTRINVTCGTVTATCVIQVAGMGDNLLASTGWHSGEISETTGEIVDSGAAYNYSDPIDISAFAGTIWNTTCDCSFAYSRVAMYDGNMAYLGSLKFGKYQLIPENAKYARFSIYYGAGKMLTILGDRNNLWEQLEINEGSYSAVGYDPNDTESMHIRVPITVGISEILATTGAWGVAFLESDGIVRSYMSPDPASCVEIPTPGTADIMAVCASDSNLSNCVCNRMGERGYGMVGISN